MPANTLDDINNAIQSAETTGWDVVVAVVVMVAAYPLARLARRYGRRTIRKIPNAPKLLVLDVGRLAYWTVWLLAAGIALSALGIGIGWFTIAVVAGMILAVLMIRPIIESMAAGLVLTTRPAFEIGDQIDVDGLRGTVLDIGTRTTQLKTSDGVRIYLPNTQLLNQTIKVYTAFDNRRASFDVVLARGVDLDAAATTIMKAVQAADGVVSDPAPTVEASALLPNGITFSVEYWYASSHLSSGSVTDAAIRSVDRALVSGGVHLAAPLVDVTSTSADPAGEQADHPGPVSDPADSKSDPVAGSSGSGDATSS